MGTTHWVDQTLIGRNSFKSCRSKGRKYLTCVLWVNMSSFQIRNLCMETIDDDSSQRSNKLDVICQHFRIRLDFRGDKQYRHSLPERISSEDLVEMFRHKEYSDID